MKTLKRFLVIRNGSDCRIVTNRPTFLPNEVAFELILKVPEAPKILGTIDITLPDPPPCPDPMVHLVDLEGDPADEALVLGIEG